jgi:hypothetical protein
LTVRSQQASINPFTRSKISTGIADISQQASINPFTCTNKFR